jgi:hypothetical protein
VISVLLSGSMDLASLPRVPLRPTHSRHNSHSDISLNLLQAMSPLAGGGSSSCGGSQPGTPTTALVLAPLVSAHLHAAWLMRACSNTPSNSTCTAPRRANRMAATAAGPAAAAAA